MISTKKYLKGLERVVRKSPDGWRIVGEQIYDDDFDKIKFENTLESLGATETLAKFRAGKLEEYMEINKDSTVDEIISKLALSLIEDIEDCTSDQYNSKLKQTHLTLLPLKLVNAFCFNRSEGNELLDGYIICINQGLFFCLKLLAKAIVIEQLSGELTQFNSGGGHPYKCAIKLFLKPTREDLNEIFFEDLPPHLLGQIEAYQSKVSGITLQFIALHEFGHIVHDDLNNMGLYQTHLTVAKGLSNTTPTHLVDKYWEAEYRADEFAMQALCNRSTTSLSAWANFTAIYLFFYWLSDIEKIIEKNLCPYHPPPKARAMQLKEFMLRLYGRNQEAEELLKLIDEKSLEWMKGVEHYLTSKDLG